MTSSRKTAMPWTGSAQQGPCAVASWKAYAMVEEKVRADMVRSVELSVSASGEDDSRSLRRVSSEVKMQRDVRTPYHISHPWSRRPRCLVLFSGDQRL